MIRAIHRSVPKLKRTNSISFGHGGRNGTPLGCTTMTELPTQNTPSGNEDELRKMGLITGQLLHDMANLVAVVHGRAQLALDEAEEGRTPKRELGDVIESTGDLGRMLRDTLDTVRGGVVSPETSFSPEEVARRVVGRFEKDTDNPIKIRLAAALAADMRVPGRASFLDRVLHNLVSNAMRHAQTEIEVHLWVARTEERCEIVIEVADDGPGLRGEDIPELFLPFRQGENAGTAGLGLSSLRWSLDQLGGEAEYGVAVELGGAAFRVRVPMAGPVQPIVQPDPVAVLRGKSVVVVDDEAGVRSALVRLAARLGAQAVAFDPAGRSEEEMLRQLIGSLPDVILLNLRLGTRGGGEIWRTLHSQVPALADRVIFMSGIGPDDPEWEFALETGRPVLAKPLDLESLAQGVALVVNG